MEITSPNWSNLPDDILAIIAKCLLLHSKDDFRRFRAVCHSFRSSASVAFPLHSLLPNSSFRISFSIDSTFGNGLDFLLTESTVYAIEPLDRISNARETTPTWLVKVEQSNSNSNRVHIQDPFCGFRYKNMSNKLPKSFNMLDYRVRGITKAYQLELASMSKDEVMSRAYYDERYKRVPSYFRKVVVSEHLDGFVVMAIHHITGKLVMWRNGDENCTNIDTSTLDYFNDIVYHSGKFYALGYTGLTMAIDSKSLSVTKVANPIGNLASSYHLYLVKSFTDLFLIVKMRKRVHLNVYKLNEEKHEWVQVIDGLEDRVLFVGQDCSFSLLSNEFPGCKGDCVYFIGNVPRHNNDYPGSHAWIFYLKDGTVKPLSAFPGYAKIFWPPPTWLKLHSS